MLWETDLSGFQFFSVFGLVKGDVGNGQSIRIRAFKGIAKIESST